MDSEFNKTISDIIFNATGRDIEHDISLGNIDNLPTNFELITNFPVEAYDINAMGPLNESK